MNRNSSDFFSTIPQIDIQRSRFDRSCGLKTTFSSGKLIPIYYEQVLPGDTITMDTSVVCRMSTPLFPVMGDSYIDTFFFFVPSRLVMPDFKEFMGESTSSQWDDDPDILIPRIRPFATEDNKFQFSEGSLADYFGLPVSPMSYQVEVDTLPFRAYYKIWNDYFRAQAVQDEVYIPEFGGISTILSLDTYNPSEYQSQAFNHLALMPVGKFFDYFTSCLPSPQKGQPVFIPLNGTVPIQTSDSFLVGGSGSPLTYFDSTLSSNLPLRDADGNFVKPNNLYADLNKSDFVSVNDLRMAVSIQHFLEMQARGGSRYTEIIKSFFGVTSPDARLQRPEYLGGKRIPVNVDQVVQTSSTSNQQSPLGNTGAFSLTGDVDNTFTYSATEHGMIIGLCCVRPRHTYQFGIDKKFTKFSRFDYYFPCFANISEQPVFLRELNVDLIEDGDEVFGYQEPWAEYRYGLNKVTGKFRLGVEDSLSPWVYSDYNNESSFINSEFIIESPSTIGDTLAYDSNDSAQFLADFYFKSIWTRPMPLYSIPGLSRL